MLVDKEILKKAEIDLTNAETRFKSIKISLDSIDKELAFLTMLERNLVDNINFLVKKSTISVAEAFRKAKEDLKKTRNRFEILTFDRTRFIKEYNKAEQKLKEAKDWRDLIVRKIEDADNVVYAEFGDKK